VERASPVAHHPSLLRSFQNLQQRDERVSLEECVEQNESESQRVVLGV
jgi:hypothetical protein